MKKALFALFIMPVLALAAPTGFVTDGAGVLGNTSGLERQLSDYRKASGTEIAVVTVQTLNGQDIESYANNLFHTWGIGQKGKNNGVLVLVAVRDHKMRIEVGYGLESKLNDGYCGQIIRDQMAPSFKRGDFLGGVTNAVNAIQGRLR